MNNLISRIEALESKLFVDADEQPAGVFIYIKDARKDAPPPGPVKGWKCHEHEIMRMENESEEELNQRAIAQVNPFLGENAAPVFISINE